MRAHWLSSGGMLGWSSVEFEDPVLPDQVVAEAVVFFLLGECENERLV
jgi:hypothetical protein